jgi:hypothetical protein
MHGGGPWTSTAALGFAAASILLVLLARRRSSRPSTAQKLHPEESTALREIFASKNSGPCPLDADTVELALFAVGWRHLQRDLRLVLTPEALAATEAVLAVHHVRKATVCRENLVNYKKVLLGLYQSAVTLSHDLRQLATFFREPPAEYAARNARDGGLGFQRPERYCSLSDALCTAEGAAAGVLDGRKFIKGARCALERARSVQRAELTRSSRAVRVARTLRSGLLRAAASRRAAALCLDVEERGPAIERPAALPLSVRGAALGGSAWRAQGMARARRRARRRRAASDPWTGAPRPDTSPR